MIAIPSATPCPCGKPVLLMQIDAGPGRRWQAHCDECCLTPPPRTSPVAGYGDTPDEALWDWQVTSDLERGVQIVPVTTLRELERQVTKEHERQRGWRARRVSLTSTLYDRMLHDEGAVLYGPPDLTPAPEQAA